MDECIAARERIQRIGTDRLIDERFFALRREKILFCFAEIRIRASASPIQPTYHHPSTDTKS